MRFIRVDQNNKVTQERTGTEKLDGELQSDLGELGQIMQSDGSFIDDTPPPAEPSQLDRVEAKLNADLESIREEGREEIRKIVREASELPEMNQEARTHLVNNGVIPKP